jgi:hypothetical protein
VPIFGTWVTHKNIKILYFQLAISMILMCRLKLSSPVGYFNRMNINKNMYQKEIKSKKVESPAEKRIA